METEQNTIPSKLQNIMRKKISDLTKFVRLLGFQVALNATGTLQDTRQRKTGCVLIVHTPKGSGVNRMKFYKQTLRAIQIYFASVFVEQESNILPELYHCIKMIHTHIRKAGEFYDDSLEQSHHHLERANWWMDYLEICCNDDLIT